jgi:hypothetical protein
MNCIICIYSGSYWCCHYCFILCPSVATMCWWCCLCPGWYLIVNVEYSWNVSYNIRECLQLTCSHLTSDSHNILLTVTRLRQVTDDTTSQALSAGKSLWGCMYNVRLCVVYDLGVCSMERNSSLQNLLWNTRAIWSKRLIVRLLPELYQIVK